MNFFHVYNDDCFAGLEKNGLINRDTGFKLQHCFAVPKHRLFNNAGNERDIKRGDVIHHEADRTVTVNFREAVTPELLVEGAQGSVTIQRVDDKAYRVHIPATSFVILAF